MQRAVRRDRAGVQGDAARADQAAAGPLIVAALDNGHGYQSVFYFIYFIYFIAGTWLVGAIVLAVFGTRTRSTRLAEAERQRVGVPA